MNGLLAQQTALLRAIHYPAANAHDSVALLAINTLARGLKVYKSNAQALAERSLQATFPVVAQLLSLESFVPLAHAFWHAHPPQRGDMAQWGAELPLFLATSEQLQGDPYLPDIARAEWALHTAASAADKSADTQSFSLLVSQDPADICLQLAPGTALVDSLYPVASILCAHTDGTPTLQEAGLRMQQGVAETALIWRQGYKPCARETLPGEAALLSALLRGESLASALASASALNLNEWLPQAVHTGLLLSAHLITTKELHE